MKKRRIFSILSVVIFLILSVTVSAEEITDACGDFSLVFEKSDFWSIKTNNSDKLGGDTGRFQRSSSATGSDAPKMQFITYQAENISNAEILYYYTSDVALSAFSVSYSKDNLQFTPVTCKKTVYQNTSGSWKGMWFDTGKLPYGTRYIRLEVAKEAPATGCGIGQVSINTFAEITKPYCDSLSFPFADADKPWRVDIGTAVANHADTTVRQTGDYDVLHATSSGSISEIVFGVIPEMEFLATVYLSQGSLAEESFCLEFSEDLTEWKSSEPYLIPYINAKNISTETYYATILKATVPESCKFARITWRIGGWQYMLGEVELREAVRKDLFTDDLEDFKTAVAGSLYMKNEAGYIMKTPYCSGDKKFSETARIVEKYGVYSNCQYLVWEVDASKGRGFCAEASYNRIETATAYPMQIYAARSLNGPWQALEVTTDITDASVSDSVRAKHYAENIPEDARYIKVQWADVVNRFDYIQSVELYEKKPITIDRLQYFSDGTLLKKTPDFYLGTTAITGRINNPNRSKIPNFRTVAALYDGTGKLVSVHAEKLRGEVPANGEKLFSVAVSDRYATAKKLKLFFWDGLVPIQTEIEDVSYSPEEFEQTAGELVDTFADYSKLYDHPKGFRLEHSHIPEKFYDFSQRIMREYPIEQSLKYCVPNAKSMVIDGFILSKLGDLRIYASCYDGGYQLIPHQKGRLTYTNGGWYHRSYTVEKFPENTQFIKIVVEGNNGAAEYSPCIGRVRISYSK